MASPKPRMLQWEHVVSAAMAPPAVPMTARTYRLDEDGVAFAEFDRPVLGVLVEIVEVYERAWRGDFDAGLPKLPTYDQLRMEGYTLVKRETRLSYVVPDDMDGEPRSSGTPWFHVEEEGSVYFPTGGAPDRDTVKEIKLNVRHRVKLRGEAAANPPAKG